MVYPDSLPSLFPFPPGEAGARRKWHQPHGRGAGDHVGARAEPAPPGTNQRRDPPTEAEEAHPEEPGLRRQLPGEASHPERGAGEAEGSAAAGGGQTGQRERVDAHRAGRSEVQVRGVADLRQDCGTEPHGRGRGEGWRGRRRGGIVCHRSAYTGKGGDGDERDHNSQVEDGRAVLRRRARDEGGTGWSSAASE